MKKHTTLLFSWIIAFQCWGQATIDLRIHAQNIPVPLAEVTLNGEKYQTDLDGLVSIPHIPNAQVQVSKIGFYTLYTPMPVQLSTWEIELQKSSEELAEVRVISERKHLDHKEAPVHIQVLGERALNSTQSLTVAEGLNFTPGLRVEYNCQNCGFSQVRLNGLEGPYSLICINNRPIFSALSSVYGLEHIPTNRIDRIEITRGGGSSLNSSNAIAGTINIITKEPIMNEWSFQQQTTLNNLTTPDYLLRGNFTKVGSKSSLGLWATYRYRLPLNANPHQFYDRDGDGILETADDFSELTKLHSLTGGLTYIYRFGTRQKLTINTLGLYEYRRGGNRFSFMPHEADIAEQLIHQSGAIDIQYEWLSKNGHTLISSYAAGAYTDRWSYYGSGGNSLDSAERYRARLFYGYTSDFIANMGMMLSQNLGLRSTLRVGIDGQFNRVRDHLTGYSRNILQTVYSAAFFGQWMYLWNEKWTSEVGIRYDQPTLQSSNSFAADSYQSGFKRFHTINPRLNILYKPTTETRFRFSYARGFRAPQAFNEDLHLSTLGGDARMIVLSNQLQAERSHGINISFEKEIHLHPWEAKFSVNTFYTKIMNPYVNTLFTDVLTLGGDTIAFIDTKVNDPNGLYVGGITIETQWSHPSWTFELGYTAQNSAYFVPRVYFEGVSSIKLLRSPQQYAYGMFTYFPNKHWKFDLSTTITGSMLTLHQRKQQLKSTPVFTDVNFSIQRSWNTSLAKWELELGCYNLLNQYQPDLEVGWERDASYIYGPIRPLSIYFGISISSL